MLQIEAKESHEFPYKSAVKTILQNKLNSREWGFSKLPHREEDWTLAAKVGSQLKENFDHLVVIGMGGSSLGSKALIEALAPEAPVSFWNTSDPDTIERSLNSLPPLEKVHWLVISKSGGTLETISLMNIALQRIAEAGLDAKSQMSVITENHSSTLHDFAKNNELTTYSHPLDVGGRFSVFTLVGLIPAAYAGIPVQKLHSGMLELETTGQELIINTSSLVLESFGQNLMSTVLWPYSDRLKGFCHWLIQLWSESLGKAKTINDQTAPPASLPTYCLGALDQHSVLQQLAEGQRDKWILFFKVNELPGDSLKLTDKGMIYPELIQNRSLAEICNVQCDATYEALKEMSVPTDRMVAGEVSPRMMGELLYLFEWVISIVGEHQLINPFDQPGVERGKVITKEKLLR